MFMTRRLQKLEKFAENLRDWPSISGFDGIEAWIEQLAGKVFRSEVKELRLELNTIREENQLLLNYLGLTIVSVGSKEIRKIKSPKKEN